MVGKNIYFASGCTSINRGSCALIFLVVWIVYEVVAKMGRRFCGQGNSQDGLGEEEMRIEDKE